MSIVQQYKYTHKFGPVFFLSICHFAFCPFNFFKKINTELFVYAKRQLYICVFNYCYYYLALLLARKLTAKSQQPTAVLLKTQTSDNQLVVKI